MVGQLDNHEESRLESRLESRFGSFSISRYFYPAFFVVGLSIAAYLYYSTEGRLVLSTQNVGISLLAGFYLTIIGGLWTFSTSRLDRHFDWRDNFIGRLLSGITLHEIILFLPFGLLYYASQLNLNLLVKIFILTMLVVIVHELIRFMLYSYQQYTEGQIRSIRQNREQLNLQFEALRSQLSPHYLFNSLNTVSSLIEDDPKPAEAFVRRLVETYQYIIASQEKKLVTYEEEISFVKAYVFLLKVRFGEAIKINYQLEESIMQDFLPPMTLQILVENAIKHNYFSLQEPLVIDVNSEVEGQVCITNAKRPKKEETTSFHIGLDNIIQRYQFFTNRPIIITDESTFKVKLPSLSL